MAGLGVVRVWLVAVWRVFVVRVIVLVLVVHTHTLVVLMA